MIPKTKLIKNKYFFEVWFEGAPTFYDEYMSFKKSLETKPKYKLKILILEKFERQYRCAKALGIRDDELSAIINGRKYPCETLIKDLARILKCTREELDL